ncbi:dynein axonemal intermediate chain 7 homolog isoform X2 [Acropora millepora]|nr:dynein axonemal intermediate chain 7 homolog isoform X2 [Acropora millepora]
MLCDGSPDLLSSSELNTYMNLWRDDKDFESFNTVLQEDENTLKLVKELKNFLSNSEDEGFNENEIQRLKESIIQLEDLISYKLDEATMNILQNASNDVDLETQNLHFTSASENIAVCVWGNIAKNPRVKSFSFPEIGFSMELPRVLAVGNVAIRIMHTKYDHLSPLSKSFYPKRKVKPPEVVVEVAPAVEETDGDGAGEDNAGGDKEGVEDILDMPPKSASQASKLSKQGRKKSGRTSSGKSSRSRRASAKSIKSQTSDIEPQLNKEGEAKEGNQDRESEDKPGSATPAVEEAAATAASVEPGFEDEEEEDDDVVDLRAYSAIGPLMFIELLELPPQPKVVRGWTMQQVVSSELKRVNYQTEEQPSADSNSVNSVSGTPAPPNTGSATQVQITSPPVMVTCTLPDHVMYFESPQLAYWDAEKHNWKLDAFTDSQYDEEKRCIQFKMSSFGPVATFQDLYLNMPFQSWELRPHSTNSCLFTLIAAIIELEIEIKDSLCALTQPEDAPELAHLKGKWMKPQRLIEFMQKAGVNVFPAVDAEKYVSINSKEDWLESNIYQEMALTASAFAYTWSKWNADCGKDKIIIQAVEQLQDEQPLEEDWSLYNIGTHSSCKMRMKEDDNELSNDVAENTQLHSGLYHMVLDGASEEAQERVNASHFLFIDCVYQLLDASKIITYS